MTGAGQGYKIIMSPYCTTCGARASWAPHIVVVHSVVWMMPKNNSRDLLWCLASQSCCGYIIGLDDDDYYSTTRLGFIEPGGGGERTRIMHTIHINNFPWPWTGPEQSRVSCCSSAVIPQVQVVLFAASTWSRRLLGGSNRMEMAEPW